MDDRRRLIVSQTPLYYVMETLGAVQRPEQLYRVLYESLSTDPDLMQREVLRRYKVSLAGVFGDERAMVSLLEHPRYRELFERLVVAMVREQISRHTESRLVRIAEMLLRKGRCRTRPTVIRRLGEPR